MTYLLISAIPTTPAPSSTDDPILGKPAVSIFGEVHENEVTSVRLIEDCLSELPGKSHSELAGKLLQYAKGTFIYKGIDTYILKNPNDADKLSDSFVKVLSGHLDNPIDAETVLDVGEFLDFASELLYDCHQVGDYVTISITKLVDIAEAGIEDLPNRRGE